MVQEIGEVTWVDVLVIVIYFVIVLAVGLWSSYRSSRGTISGFFLAGRDMHWLLVGASLFASNIGSGHFVGLAGSGAAAGIAVGGFELNAIFVLVMLGWLFVPVYISSGVYTMPEYLKKRFGGWRIRVYLSVLALLLYTFTKISADLFAGAIFIKQSLNISLYPSIGILLLIACLFTVAGGLTAVIWTDAVQVVIMIIGSFILMGVSFAKVGGYSKLTEDYFLAIPHPNNTAEGAKCAGLPRMDALKLFRDPTTGDLPWTGMIFGLTISSIWYWCSDQVIVQRALAAKNYSHAKGGCVFAGWLKFLPLWLLVFPGMAARVLFPDKIGCTDPEVCFGECGVRTGCSNIAYPLLVVELLPQGLRGLMLACMLSALMSSLTSIFNSSSTIFTIDIWKLIRKKASDAELLIVGRLFVVALVVVGILWIPIIQAFSDSQLFNYIQSVTSYLAPPVCAVYCLAIFVPRVNEPGAFWGLMVGLAVGLVRFIVECSYSAPLCNEIDTRPFILTSMHYLHFGILLFVIVVVVTVVVSLMTPPIEAKNLHRLTFWTRYSEVDRISLADEAEFQKNKSKGRVFSVDAPTPTTPGPGPPQRADVPCWRKAVNFMCGIDQEAKQLSAAETQEIQKHMISLKETPFWRLFWNINAVLVMTVAVFFWAFFA